MEHWEKRTLRSIAIGLTILALAAIIVLGVMSPSASAQGEPTYESGRESIILTAIARLEEKVSALQATQLALIQQGMVTTQQHDALIRDMQSADADLRAQVTKVADSLAESRESVAGLAVKSGMIGLLGGIIPSAGALMFYTVQKKRNGNGKTRAKTA